MALKFPGARGRHYRRTLQYTNCILILSALIQYRTQQGISVLDGVLVSMVSPAKPIAQSLSLLLPLPLQMSVMMLSCMFGFLPSYVEHTSRFDALLCAFSIFCTSAWGVFIWREINFCYSDAVVVILGKSIYFDNYKLVGFGVGFYAGLTGYVIVVVFVKNIG